MDGLQREPSQKDIAFFYDLLALQRDINYRKKVGKERIIALAKAHGRTQEEVDIYVQNPEIFSYHFYRRITHIAWAIKKAHFFSKIFKKDPAYKHTETLALSILERKGVETTALVDLGAFSKEHMETQCSELKDKGIERIVLMEDRNPLFFLNFQEFDPECEVPLNRHGPHHQKWSQKDLLELVRIAHKHELEVVIGFWCNYTFLDQKVRKKLRGHRDNDFIQNNEDALAPVLVDTDDMNIYCMVEYQGKKMKFAEAIAHQYEKLVDVFGFDGLFIGDGGMGFRNFLHLDNDPNFSFMCEATYDFYKVLHTAVKKKKGLLFAYDCNGYSYEEAVKRGVDYRWLLGANPQKKAVLDVLVLQMYPEAWGRYMRVPGRLDIMKVKDAMHSVLEATQGLPGLCSISLEIGDTVEGWRASRKQLVEQVTYFDRLSTCYTFETLGVWMNDWVADLYS